MKLSTIGLVMTAKFEIKAYRSRWKLSASIRSTRISRRYCDRGYVFSYF